MGWIADVISRGRRGRALLVIAVLGAWPFAAAADVVQLRNGDRLTGSVERIRAGKIELTTPHAGSVFIKTGEIETLATDRIVTVILRDYGRHIGRLVPVGPGRLGILVDGTEEIVDVPLDRVSVLLPGHIDATDWRVTGRVNVGLTDTEGNTEVRRMNADTEVIARRNRDRLALSARGNQSVESGDQTEANATVGLKYDRFLTERWYGFGGSTFEHDALKDLRLRSTLGGGLGHNVIESGRTTLALEGGLDWVRTDFFSSSDQSNTALRLATRFDHTLIEGLLDVFHYNQVFLGISYLKQSFARTQTGARLPLRSGVLFAVTLNLDWDGEPAPGRKSLDRSLVLSLGYRW